MKRKIAIIGVGHVGAHCAYALACMGICDELLLVDENKQKAVSECNDLRDSVSFFPHGITVKTGDFTDLEDYDIIINSIGKIDILRQSNDRLDELSFTLPAADSIAEKIKASHFKGVLINITNPCDIITHRLAKSLNLPKGRVFGTGTGLDSARLISLLSRHTNTAPESVLAYMLGEHGASQFAPGSCISFSGIPYIDWIKENPDAFDLKQLEKDAVNGAWLTFKGKGCTEYAIASTAAKMANAVLCGENIIMAASAELCGEYGQDGIFAGVPCVIGSNGIEKVLELPLNYGERIKFDACCNTIRKNMENCI